jgi:HD-GYP domain-containing protein (c-di-GMP phosphodiesterase class II)
MPTSLGRVITGAARTPQEAIAELRRCAGRQFDPQVVDLVCTVLADEDEPATTLAIGG